MGSLVLQVDVSAARQHAGIQIVADRRAVDHDIDRAARRGDDAKAAVVVLFRTVIVVAPDVLAAATPTELLWTRAVAIIEE